MRRLYSSAIPVLFFFTATAFAAEPNGKVIKETWEAVFVEANQIGHAHSVFREIERDGVKYIDSTMELELTLNRFGQTLQLSFAVADRETADGKVVGLVVQQGLSKTQKIIRKGKVVGNELVITTEIGMAPPREKKIPWNDKILGLYGEEKLFHNRDHLQPNAKFDYLKFVPDFDAVLGTHVEVKDYEEVPLLGGGKKRLLRIESKTEKVMNINLPAEIAWLDAKGEALKRQAAIPGLGQLVMYRTTKPQALARGGKGPKLDIGTSQLVPVKSPLADAAKTREVVYRIRVKDVEVPENAFARDEGQQVRNVKDKEFDLVVKGLRQPETSEAAAAEMPKDYLQSNRFIKSDDVKVKEFASRAVGKETDPWKQAIAIERWVFQQIKNKNYTEAFATADEVARSLEGDCTEHSVLAAAMCRAVGVPARGAVGLVYVPSQKSMAFHMWIEVWINGKWFPLDPTMGLSRVAADHIKVLDHSWNGVDSFTPLLPVVNVLGKLEIDVAQAAY